MDFPERFQGPGGIPEASQSLSDPSCMNMSPNRAIWTCFGSVFMISFQSMAFSNLHNLYICCIETIYLLYKDRTVYVWPYHNSENPYRQRKNFAQLPSPRLTHATGPMGPPWGAMVGPRGPKGPCGDCAKFLPLPVVGATLPSQHLP